MTNSIVWDRYTVLMVALVPFLLLSAWGLDAWDKHRLHTQQCALAIEWLEDSADEVARFENAGTLGNIEMWISTIKELNSPASAGQMRWGILQSARYQLEYYPASSTAPVGVLNPPDGLYWRDINEGREGLVKHCPGTAALIPQAFPMVFAEGDD